MSACGKLLVLASLSLLSSQAVAQPLAEPGGRPQDVQLALNNPDEYAWRLFFYLNHQAELGKAGVADSTKKSLREFDPDRAVVWKSWALASGLVLNSNLSFVDNKSEVYKRPATQPLEWDKLDRGKPKEPLGPSSKKIAPLLSLLKRQRPSGSVISSAPLGVPGGDQEVRMNKSTFDTIRTNRLYSVEGIEAAALKARAAGTTTIVQFDAASKEVKAQWVLLPGCEPDKPCANKERYHWRTVVNPATNKGEVWGLAALHVITKDLPNWFWADFGHIHCETGADACAPGPRTATTRCAIPRRADRAERDRDLRAQTDMRTETLQTKWANYRLRGTQIEFVTGEGRPTILSNPVIELDFQKSSCMTCHSFATVGVRGTVPNSGSSFPFFANFDFVRNIGSSPTPDIDIGTPNCLKFFNQTSGACASADNGPPPLYFQTDFIWSMPFRAFSEKP